MKRKLIKDYPLLGSSVDPEKISLTIKSVGLALVPLAAAICRAFDLEIAENDLVLIVTNIAGIASMLGVIYGVFRKFNK